MDPINSPHDRFFHAVFSDEENARDLLRNALPGELLRQIELSPLQISRESYVDEHLAVHQSDLLIRTRYRDRPVFLYFLVEHKSQPSRWTLLQLLRYMVRIWDKELARNKKLKKLPPIIPMIFYHGARRWNQPLDFTAYVELQESVHSYVPDFEAILFDLQQTDEDELHGAVLFRTAMKIAKYAHTHLQPHLREILRAVSIRPLDERTRSFLKMFLRYILQVGRDTPRAVVLEEIDKVNDEEAREVYMTAAEELRAEGIEIGRQEGRQEGNIEGRIVSKQEVLVRLLEKKFGPLESGAKQTISGCRDLNRLDEVIDLFLDADSVEEILQPLV
jgi:predicted transposase/invertase (TIGR01784 family)